MKHLSSLMQRTVLVTIQLFSQFLTSMMNDMSGGGQSSNMDPDMNRGSNYDTSNNEYNYDNVKQFGQRQQTPRNLDKDRDRDYNQRRPDTSRDRSRSRHSDINAPYGGRYDEQQQHDDHYHHNDEVNIFKNDNDVNPTLTFDGGIDWLAIKQNFNLYAGWLKHKNDPTGKRVRSPFQPGDYTLVDAVPEFKRIRIVFSSVINYWDSDQKVLIKHGDTSDDIRKKIQNTLKFDRRHFSLYQLIESGTHNKVNVDYNELDENKTYELIIPWLSKLQKKKEDQIVANKPNTPTTGTTATTSTDKQATSTTTPATTSSTSDGSHHKRNCTLQ